MRKFLKLSYSGTPYHGWQSQPNASSVQQTLEEALSTILRGPAPVTGAGRTDTAFMPVSCSLILILKLKFQTDTVF